MAARLSRSPFDDFSLSFDPFQTSHVPISNEYDLLTAPETSTRLTMRFETPLEEVYSLFALLVTNGSVNYHSG